MSFSQSARDIARDGNKNYEKGLFADSEVDYRKSLSENKLFEEAQFNLSDALFKQERYDESINVLNNLINTTQNKEIKADSQLYLNFVQNVVFEIPYQYAYLEIDPYVLKTMYYN